MTKPIPFDMNNFEIAGIVFTFIILTFMSCVTVALIAYRLNMKKDEYKSKIGTFLIALLAANCILYWYSFADSVVGSF